MVESDILLTQALSFRYLLALIIQISIISWKIEGTNLLLFGMLLSLPQVFRKIFTFMIGLHSKNIRINLGPSTLVLLMNGYINSMFY